MRYFFQCLIFFSIPFFPYLMPTKISFIIASVTYVLWCVSLLILFIWLFASILDIITLRESIEKCKAAKRRSLKLSIILLLCLFGWIGSGKLNNYIIFRDTEYYVECCKEDLHGPQKTIVFEGETKYKWYRYIF